MADDRESDGQATGAVSGASSDFIRAIVADDLAANKHQGRVATRFPPEPNGYLHIGHAKSICLNFGIARDVHGTCNLRFDDTNPTKEDVEYVDAILEDVRWLGFDWADRLHYASDYFERLYEFAEHLIRTGLAYVDDLSTEEIRAHRGTLTEAGRPSPFRDRSNEDSLDLFHRMRAGEFPDGSHVLRARIDMASPNINMRDPVLYRIRRAQHHRTGDAWCIYPLYDYTHCISDALERITHSICTLEFEDHRPLYDWILDRIPVDNHPRQIEFARLNLTYTVLSKRKLLELVESGRVTGWDDPQMPTLRGLRRRGFTPEALRAFCERIGVSKRDSTVDVALLEHAVREDLNSRAPRAMVVTRPIRLVLENYPDDQVEEFELPVLPDDPSRGTRRLPFSKVLFIEQEDFREEPPPKYWRLAPGREVRLRGAYLIQCTGFSREPGTGAVSEIRCTYDPATRGGDAPDGRKVKSTIHWVSGAHSIPVELRLYERLFTAENPGGDDWLSFLNPRSLEVVEGSRAEPGLAAARPGDSFQFERQGYFCVDRERSHSGSLVFHRTVGLKDAWARIEAKEPGRQRQE